MRQSPRRSRRRPAVLAAVGRQHLQLLEHVVHGHERLVLAPGDFALAHPERLDFDAHLRAFVVVALGLARRAAHEELAAGDGNHLERDVGAGNLFRVRHHVAAVDFDGRTVGGLSRRRCRGLSVVAAGSLATEIGNATATKMAAMAKVWWRAGNGRFISMRLASSGFGLNCLIQDDPPPACWQELPNKQQARNVIDSRVPLDAGKVSQFPIMPCSHSVWHAN